MLRAGRARVWVLVLGAALGGAGAARAEPLLGQDLQLSDSAGLFPTVTFTPNADAFSFVWAGPKAGDPAVKIDVLQQAGDDAHAWVTLTSLSDFQFPAGDVVT